MRLFRPMRALLTILFVLPAAGLAQDGPESVLPPSKRFQKRVVVSGLAGPWEITWGPDQWIWTTERTGKCVTRVNPATGERQVAVTIDEVLVPGGQDGVLGMALHPDLLAGKGADYVYVFYTYSDQAKGPDLNVADPRSPYRFLYGKIVRFTYRRDTGKLESPLLLISGLPAGNDHSGGRLKVGPDRKLYLTLGDQGHNQLGNYCLPIESQKLPGADQVKRADYALYVGKTLRLNLDGSIPSDNPKWNGIMSHIYTIGHRNIQGIDFGPDGKLYAAEHGPKTDDEINLLKSGGNYGWPNVAGLQDNKAYEYARWAEASTPCAQLTFSDLAIHPSVPRAAESAYQTPFVPPIATMFTVPTGYNFKDPACRGVDYICWPTVGIAGIEFYQTKPGGKGIPGWENGVLLVTTLKRGSLYVAPLTASRDAVAGPMSRYFRSENRYRDTTLHPDGRTIYIATDAGGLAESATGGVTRTMQDSGAILAFTYEGEGRGADTPKVSESRPPAAPRVVVPLAPVSAKPAVFTAAQAAEGKTAYNSYCAVCHGSTMTNGTFGTPLAGDYFKQNWGGRSLRALFEKSKETMPPAAPRSLSDAAYANILAHVLATNGYRAGKTPLPAKAEALGALAVK